MRLAPRGGGDDRGPLVWISVPLQAWPKAIDQVAVSLIEARSAAKAFQPNGSGAIAAIHLLGYPAGNKWQVSGWDGQKRLASPLRFKVIRDGDHVRVLACHLPCAVPKELRELLDKTGRRWLEEHSPDAWRAIHRSLDEDRRMVRVTEPWPDRPAPPGRSPNRRGGQHQRGRTR